MSKYDKVKEYILKNLDHYSENELIYLIENYDKGPNGYLPDVLRQIYSELDLLEENDIYEGFVNLLKENFDIEDRNITEIGGGIIPSLANKVSFEIGKGKVTVYDPKLMENYANKKLVLKKEMFTDRTDIKDTDMLIALMPCNSTETIIKKACLENKDFIIGLCDGDFHEFDTFYDTDAWHKKIIDFATSEVDKNNMGTLEVTDLKKYSDPYPVIYNKRRATK